MAATMKRSLVWLINLTALAVLALIMASNAQSNTCNTSLGNLNVCAPFVVPGSTATTPSADCCAALQGVDHECICNTLRVAARIPAQCNIAPLACPSN